MDKKITIDGVDTFYQEVGHGKKTMVLLHGWGQSHAFWNDFVRRFEKDYRILVLDLPGFGLSQEPPTTWKVTDYAEFLYQFTNVLHVTQPLIIGHSFGGRIAVVYASRYPITKLILYSSAGGLPENSFRRRLQKEIFGLLKYLFPNLSYRIHTTLFKPKQYVNKVIINTKRSRRVLDIYSQRSQNLTQSLQKISVKTLIIAGRKDFIINPDMGKKLHKIIPSSQLAEINKATHFAHLETPKEFYEVVEAFIKR